MRSDKKVDLKATMSLQSKERLYQFAEMCEEPVKDVAERLCALGSDSQYVIDDIRGWFRRNYYYKNSIVIGYLERPKLTIISLGETSKVSIKFHKENYDKLCAVAYALDITPSSTASVLIVTSLKNHAFMDDYIAYHLQHLEENSLKEIRQFL